jgi:hypothetical protein
MTNQKADFDLKEKGYMKSEEHLAEEFNRAVVDPVESAELLAWLEWVEAGCVLEDKPKPAAMEPERRA